MRVNWPIAAWTIRFDVSFLWQSMHDFSAAPAEKAASRMSAAKQNGRIRVRDSMGHCSERLLINQHERERSTFVIWITRAQDQIMTLTFDWFTIIMPFRGER